MNIQNYFQIDKQETINKICKFLNLKQPESIESTTKEAIKQLCTLRLCKAIGITGNYKCKSEFFEFFSCVMGEAVCEYLSIKIHIASDEFP